MSSSMRRIIVEHVIAGVKHCRIVEDIFREKHDGYDDLIMEMATNLSRDTWTVTELQNEIR